MPDLELLVDPLAHFGGVVAERVGGLEDFGVESGGLLRSLLRRRARRARCFLDLFAAAFDLEAQ